MASKPQPDCETVVITVPEHLDPFKATPRTEMKLISLRLKATLDGLDLEQIRGVVGWNNTICVATNKFLVFFHRARRLDDSNDFKRRSYTALPPEIWQVVTIAAGPESLFVVAYDWIWTLSNKFKLSRWIELPNVSSISVNHGGKVLLVEKPTYGIATLKMCNKDGAVLQKFVMPREYESMTICQAGLTNSDEIVVSICGQGTKRLLFIQEGVVRRMYDSSRHESMMPGMYLQEMAHASIHSECEISNQFIAVGYRPIVAETYSTRFKSSCPVCKEKIMVLDKDFQLNQIILPDLLPHFKHYSRICYSGKELIVACMKVSYEDDTKSVGPKAVLTPGRKEVLTPVVNVYEIDYDISGSEGEGEETIKKL